MFKLKKSTKKHKKIKKKNIKSNPLISIITVVKNDEKKILKTIKSVFNQSYKNFEYIIIDGASKDKTINILKKNQKKIDILISKKDKNLWSAMNKGIALSSGSIIGIINSGDTYYRNTLKYVKKYFTSNSVANMYNTGSTTDYSTSNTIHGSPNRVAYFPMHGDKPFNIG